MNYSYSTDWIHNLESKKHWQLYWHQQKLLENRISVNDKILEVGVGSGFTANYLKSKGFNVKTVDIDQNKNPDIVKNIVYTEPKFFNFDVLLAFNIFEHIPYDEFLKFLEKLQESRVSRIFLCLPVFKKIVFEAYFYFLPLPPCRIKLFLKKRKLSTNHHWELEYEDNNLHKLKSDIYQRNFLIGEEFKYYNQQYLFIMKDNSEKSL